MGTKSKCRLIMASHDEMEVEKGEQQIPKGEPDLDCNAQHVQNLVTPKNFHD